MPNNEMMKVTAWNGAMFSCGWVPPVDTSALAAIGVVAGPGP